MCASENIKFKNKNETQNMFIIFTPKALRDH